MIEVEGRLEDWDPCSAHQVFINSSHSSSENPEDGLPGRSPSRTLYITAGSAETSQKGRHPVMTYPERDTIIQRAVVWMKKALTSRIVMPKA